MDLSRPHPTPDLRRKIIVNHEDYDISYLCTTYSDIMSKRLTRHTWLGLISSGQVICVKDRSCMSSILEETWKNTTMCYSLLPGQRKRRSTVFT